MLLVRRPPDRTEESLRLVDPAKQTRLDAMLTVFTVYHAVKLGHRAAVAEAGRTGKYHEVLLTDGERCHSALSQVRIWTHMLILFCRTMMQFVIQ